jgi:hypothetical protein
MTIFQWYVISITTFLLPVSNEWQLDIRLTGARITTDLSSANWDMILILAAAAAARQSICRPVTN